MGGKNKKAKKSELFCYNICVLCNTSQTNKRGNLCDILAFITKRFQTSDLQHRSLNFQAQTIGPFQSYSFFFLTLHKNDY